MHPQLISIKNLEESKLQYRDIPQEDVEKLADLIELDGEVLQPLLVRKAGADTYEILAGHKRYRACKYLSEVRKLEQFSMIPCYVKSMTDAQAEFAVYSTNGYNGKTDYEIMREVEGMSRLLKENPELFPEAASGRLVEKLAKIMNLSKTTVQEYKTIANNLSDEAMDKFKNNEITKESAKTLAGLSSEEQQQVIATGVTETKDIKEAAKTIRNPSMSEIKSAFNAMYKSALYPGFVVRNYSSLEECFKEKEGRSHSGHVEYRLNYECSLRGIKINNRKEITWHEFVMAAIRMNLYTFESNDNKETDDEQLPGQDDIYNHPEYLPDNIKSYSNEDNRQKAGNENVTDSVTNTYTAEQPEENVVRHIKETKYLAGVEKIGNCPYCNSPLTFISNQKFCGSCGKGVVWSK